MVTGLCCHGNGIVLSWLQDCVAMVTGLCCHGNRIVLPW